MRVRCTYNISFLARGFSPIGRLYYTPTLECVDNRGVNWVIITSYDMHYMLLLAVLNEGAVPNEG